MGILLIESSSKKIEFGYAINSKVILNEVLNENENADTLTFFIKEAFRKNDVKFNDIEFVSLSNGPGSFTGLRVGSAIAKGICFAIGSKLIEVSTLDIIANKLKSQRKTVSLIFSNPRAHEFYFCEYIFESGKLKRLSDYKIELLENILENITYRDSLFFMNESPDVIYSQEFKDKLVDVSEFSNILSQFELTKDMILSNEFKDYRISKPFYMKEFVPKI